MRAKKIGLFIGYFAFYVIGLMFFVVGSLWLTYAAGLPPDAAPFLALVIGVAGVFAWYQVWE